MSVGRALADKTGYKLFHNHVIIELLLEFFEYGSPPFNALRRDFRSRIIAELRESGASGVVFTYVWALDDPRDEAELAGYFEGIGIDLAQVKFVELYADQAVRLERNTGEFRLR